MKTANCPHCYSQPGFGFWRRNSLGIDGVACKNCGEKLYMNVFEAVLIVPVLAIPHFIFHDEFAKAFLGTVILFLIIFSLSAAFIPFRIKAKK